MRPCVGSGWNTAAIERIYDRPGAVRFAGAFLHAEPLGRPLGRGGMDARVSTVFSPRLKFGYEYDFGSTTPLKLRVVNQLTEASAREIRMLAQNDPPACDS